LKHSRRFAKLDVPHLQRQSAFSEGPDAASSTRPPAFSLLRAAFATARKIAGGV
jgi:hypothetical protein